MKPNALTPTTTMGTWCPPSPQADVDTGSARSANGSAAGMPHNRRKSFLPNELPLPGFDFASVRRSATLPNEVLQKRGARGGRRAEVRSQKSEGRGQKAEARRQRFRGPRFRTGPHSLRDSFSFP